MNLQNLLRTRIIGDSVDVRLLSNTNLVSNRVDVLSLNEAVERKVIETAVGQSVSVILKDQSASRIYTEVFRGAYTLRS